MEEVSLSTQRSSWDAERSAFVADILRDRQRPARVRLRVFGESMLPVLWPGDEVEIAACSIDEIESGMIVLARREGRLFLHRFVKSCAAQGFQLRGDCMAAPDPWFPHDALLGRFVPNSRRQDMALYSRMLGLLLCHCNVLRRLALKWHSRGDSTRTLSHSGPVAHKVTL